MSNSNDAYLGVFADPTQITVSFDREIVEQMYQALEMDDDAIFDEQDWASLMVKLSDSDLVSNFLEGVMDLVLEIKEGK